MPGPVPNRSEDLSRERDANRSNRPPLKKGEMRKVNIPNAPRDWHPTSRRLWESLKTSGQSDFFQNSDWAFAYSVLEDFSYQKKAQSDGKRMSAETVKTLYGALDKLLMTEAERRRARIELEEPDSGGDSAGAVAVKNYKAGLGLVVND